MSQAAPLVYLKLRDDVGVEPSHVVNEAGVEIPNERAGDPAPLNNIGIQIPMPTMIGKDVGTTTVRAAIEQSDTLPAPLRARIIPGTRIVETDAPAVINLLTQTGQYELIDAPRSEQPRRPKTSGESTSKDKE